MNDMNFYLITAQCTKYLSCQFIWNRQMSWNHEDDTNIQKKKYFRTRKLALRSIAWPWWAERGSWEILCWQRCLVRLQPCWRGLGWPYFVVTFEWKEKHNYPWIVVNIWERELSLLFLVCQVDGMFALSARFSWETSTVVTKWSRSWHAWFNHEKLIPTLFLFLRAI